MPTTLNEVFPHSIRALPPLINDIKIKSLDISMFIATVLPRSVGVHPRVLGPYIYQGGCDSAASAFSYAYISDLFSGSSVLQEYCSREKEQEIQLGP